MLQKVDMSFYNYRMCDYSNFIRFIDTGKNKIKGRVKKQKHCNVEDKATKMHFMP